MSGAMMLFYISILYMLFKGVSSQNLTLAPERIDVMENTNVTLTCTTHVHFSSWTNSDNPSVWPYIILKDGMCVADGFLNNSLLYSWYCHLNGSFSLTILKVNETQHNKTWTCRGAILNLQSNVVTVNIQVRVKTVKITTPTGNNVTIVENKPKLFRCITSNSRPPPSIQWFMRLKGNTNQINASDSIEIISDEKGLTSAISVLNISVNREKQGAEIYCNGTNGIEGDVVSRNIKIDVYYAPDRGPVIGKSSNNSIYTLKENNTCNLTCIVAWANPLPKLSWNCNGTKTPYEDKRDVRLNIQWQAKRDGDKVCTCTATQEVAGVQTTSIRIEVLYPPLIETIKFEHAELHQNIQVNELIKVIEKETFKLICEAKSKPKPSYKWTGMTESNVSSITIINPQTPQTYTETCHAINVMEFNNTEKETGSINRNVQVEVLYPPTINTLADKRVTEGSDVEIRCPTTHGNPSATSYVWTREGDGSQWLNNTFTIQNVSRKDSMGYTCTANNVMVMTGNIRKNGSSSKNMTLEVLYPPGKPSLFLDSIAERKVYVPITDTLIVAERTPFSLFCNANSLPMPNLYSWDTISTWNSSIIHIPGLIRNDKHSLTCHVSNVMIPTEGAPRTGENNVTVPIDIQFSPDIGNITNIISEEGTNVNVSCPLINGNPNHTSAMWIRNKDGRKWLEPNFSLKNVSRTDSSIYTCRVNNTMVMSGGFVKEGIRNKSITMNVLYKALILNYQAVNYSTNDTVTVSENETVNLQCKIEGNPDPEGRIFSQELQKVTKSVEENYTTYSVTFKATCMHKGVYTCRGTNVIINQERISERNISLYVTCSPRQDPTSPLRKIIQTSINEALNVNFTVVAYPKPTDVLVKKYDGQSWISVNGSDNLEITHTDLDIRLFIHRVAKKDYGKYQLTIRNDYGIYEHTFVVEPPSMEASISETPSIPSVNYGLVVGLPLVLVVIIVILVIGIILYRKRNTGVPDKLIYQNVPFTGKTRKVQKKYESQRSEQANSEELQEIDDVPHYLTEPTEYSNSPEKIEQIERIKVSELFSYVSEKSYESFGIEYQKLPSGIQKPCTFARKPENLPLNRYNGIYPYDHSRVKIPSCPDFFMNACYIDGHKRKNAYIASLGPTTKTTNDFQTFWQMVWHAETDVIVMLTNLHEPSGMKCEQYWPLDGSDMDYGDICVKSKSVKVLAEYTVRTFYIIKDGRKRNLSHLHFTAWPDKTVPEDTTCLLEFRRRMKSIPTSSKGPIIVHCSAGIGRTGTLIAIDRLIEEGQDIESVNVFGCVEAMRDQRVKMVQTLEQYVYIYKALVNALVFGCETIPIGRFKNNVTQNNDNIYNKHYKQLSQSVEEEKKEDSDARAKNKRLAKYNRQGADVPGLRFRVMLCLTRQCGDHDYINAVYINTHAKKDHLIIAQTPLPDTVEDFICMIYNENCTCIVTMEDLQEPGAMIGQYVSENKHPKSYGNFTVVCSRLETKDEYIVRQMKIKYNGRIDSSEKVAYHFQYTKWMPGQDTPVSAIEFLHFIEKVENYDSEFSDNYSHILVHCLRANERSGLFCAVKILKEKISEENEINVGNVLKHLRTRRRTAVTSMEQVKFCYQAVGAFIKTLKQ